MARRNNCQDADGGRRRAYLRESILLAGKDFEGLPAVMPTFQGLVSEENLVALIEHVKSMSPNATTAQASLPASGSSAPAASKAPATPGEKK